MLKTYRYRLYPNKTQERALDYVLWQARKIYNGALAMRKEAWEEKSETISLYDLRDHWCAQRKVEPETFGILPYDTVDGLIRRLDKAYKAFFRRVKEGKEKAGFPRFKNRHTFHSLEYKHGSGCKLHVAECPIGWLKLSNVGYVKIDYHRELPRGSRVKRVVVKRNKIGHWYASCQVEIPDSDPPEHRGPAVGLDMGMVYLIALSDGRVFENPRWYREGARRRRVLNRQLARRQRNDKNGKPLPRHLQSQNWRDTRKQIAKHEFHFANQRRDYWHNVVHDLCKTYSLIVIEDLNLDFMIENKYLALSAHDAGLGMFREMLKVKAEETGTMIVDVPAAYTSQTCSQCGHVDRENRKTQADFACVSCGYQENADVNAAKNILNKVHNGLCEAIRTKRSPLGQTCPEKPKTQVECQDTTLSDG